MLERINAMIEDWQIQLEHWDFCQECAMVGQEEVEFLIEIRDKLVSLGV